MLCFAFIFHADLYWEYHLIVRIGRPRVFIAQRARISKNIQTTHPSKFRFANDFDGFIKFCDVSSFCGAFRYRPSVSLGLSNNTNREPLYVSWADASKMAQITNKNVSFLLQPKRG